MAKKTKLATDIVPPRKLSEDEVKKALEEGKKLAETFGKPKPPGDYDVRSGYTKYRGKKLPNRNCAVCNGTLEHLWELINTRPDFIGPGHTVWKLKCTRCDTCGLKYDLTGLP